MNSAATEGVEGGEKRLIQTSSGQQSMVFVQESAIDKCEQRV